MHESVLTTWSRLFTLSNIELHPLRTARKYNLCFVLSYTKLQHTLRKIDFNYVY